MLKRFLCILLAVLLPCTAALAEPRYPTRSGVTTDAASVLSVKLLEDMRTLDKRLDKADAPQLHVVTVDFLDAADVQDYADALFTRWDLDDDEVLLLLCIGEESYAIAAGKSARRILSDVALEKLLAGQLHEPFLSQQYDAAVAAFAQGYATEVNRTCGVTIKTEDLFRSVSGSLFDNWASMQQRTESASDGESFLIREDKSTGFSLLSVLLIVALLFGIFGVFRKGRRMHAPAAPEKPAPEAPPARQHPVYFKPREKKPTPQYFQPRKPR